MEKGELQKFFMFFLQSSKKRGISTIVASVLIVLITVAGVAILWAGFYPLIQQVLFIEDVNVQVKIDRSEYTQYDSENELLSVRVSRGSDEADIVGIKFIVDDSGDTFSHISYDVVEPNSAKVYSFSTYDLNSVGEISVVPIYNVNGGEKESEIKNSLEKVPKSDLSEVERKFIGFGYPEYEGLVAYYPFTNDGKDYSGNGNHGDLKDDAKIENNELVLDGANSYVSSDLNNVGIPVNGSASFSGWFKPINNSKDMKNPIYYFQLTNVIFQHESNNLLYLGGTSDFFNADLTYNSWNHIVLTYSGNTSTAKLYVNEIYYPVNIQIGSNALSAVSLFKLGSNSKSFNGTIDEVMIFDRVLSSEEIKEIYERQKKE